MLLCSEQRIYTGQKRRHKSPSSFLPVIFFQVWDKTLKAFFGKHCISLTNESSPTATKLMVEEEKSRCQSDSFYLIPPLPPPTFLFGRWREAGLNGRGRLPFGTGGGPGNSTYYTMGGWKGNGCLKSEGEGGGRFANRQEIYELCHSLVNAYEVS